MNGGSGVSVRDCAFLHDQTLTCPLSRRGFA